MYISALLLGANVSRRRLFAHCVTVSPCLRSLRLQLINLLTDLLAKLIFAFLGVLDHITNRQMRNAIALSKKLSVVGLSRAWWSTDEDFEGEEASEEIKLIV